MKTELWLLSIFLFLLFVSAALADNAPMPADPILNGVPHNANMRVDNDGNLEKDEYEVISANGSITRALCPYTCEMRGLPKQNCKQWTSVRDKSLCYVQDTRIPSDAIHWGGVK